MSDQSLPDSLQILSVLMEQIESVSFEGEMRILSDTDDFRGTYYRHEAVRNLASEMEKSPKNKEIVIRRLLTLIEEDSGDPSNAHTHDIACEAYFYALGLTIPHFEG